MKLLKDHIEEAFRAGYNAACWSINNAPEKKDEAWGDYFARPAIQSLLDKVALAPRLLTCTEHGASDPAPACKHCLDKMQRFIQLAQEKAAASHLANMQDPL